MVDGVEPGKNFNGMVRPIVPFAIRGVLWYQGESNIIAGNDGLRYADKMEALIGGWRAAWGRSDLTFLFVQLAPFAYSGRVKDKVAHPVTALPELWEAQARALKIPRTGMVPTSDLVQNLRDIHPLLKRPVAGRLEKLALAEVYGRMKLVHGGPVFEKMETRGDKALVHFRQTGDGLKSRDGRQLTHFEIAGADGIFVPARVAIEGKDVVVVYSPQVRVPKAVRFGWDETAQPNLINAEGWPAFPFRSNGPEWSPQPEK
jgi:sialate O-acetylesterase